MSTQDRLQQYQKQQQQLKAQERQVAGQIADLEMQLQSIREQQIAFGGAVQALIEEIEEQSRGTGEGGE